MASTNIQMLNRTGNNEQSDECYTPKEAILPLLPFLDKDKIYYEATSGKSNSIVNVLADEGFDVVLSGTRDFLDDPLFHYVDAIITNPPYSKKDAFIKRCYDLGKPFALLLPVSAIQGQKRGKWFSEYGIELLVLNSRIDFTGKGAPHFGVAWFCHKILPQPLIFA
jgi:hypothetical protein